MILMYHKVDLSTPTMWWVGVEAFDRQMADLQAYEVVHLNDYDPANPRHVCITFDGVYENVHRFAFPILRKWGYPFELFVIGNHIGGDNAFDDVEPLTRFCTVEQLEEMAAGGGRIQWHTASHRRLHNAPDDVLDTELLVPAALRERFPAPHFDWFAYPHGDHDQRAIERVKAQFKGALSCVAGNDSDPYQLNRETAVEETNLSTSRVTLIIANYNYGAFLPEAVDSVLAQTRQPDEFIIIDDCSTDGSQTVVQRYRDVAKIVLNEQNLGIVGNFRKAVELSTGDYIVFLGADNRMRPDYIERCKAILDSDPEAGVVYTDMIIFGARATALAGKVGAELIGKSKVERWPVYLWRFPDPTPETLQQLKQRNFIHGSSMYRRKAYDEVGGYRETTLPEDHDLFGRMVEKGWKPVRAPHALIQYRQHSYNQADTVLGLQNEAAYWRKTAHAEHQEAQRARAETEHVRMLMNLLRQEKEKAVSDLRTVIKLAGVATAIQADGLFDPKGYCERAGIKGAAPDFAAQHYLLIGERQGIMPSDAFDPAYYARENPDIVESGMGLLEHYVSFGRYEGRQPKAPEDDAKQPDGVDRDPAKTAET